MRIDSVNRSGPCSRILIGKDSGDHWIVQDETGLWGGMFVSFADALHYAKHEDETHAHTIVLVPGPLELSFGSQSRALSKAA